MKLKDWGNWKLNDENKTVTKNRINNYFVFDNWVFNNDV